MKKLILYACLALFTFSCTADLHETFADTQESYLDQLAQSDEYHNYFTALVETEAERKADPLDLEAAKALYKEGIDIRQQPTAEISHIPGAVTYARTHHRLIKVIAALRALYPEYPNGMTAEDRIVMRQRYMAYRGINPMDLALATQ